ncbi:MAG: amino acid adenylation domain-containing protein [Actinomycetota bacterium]
MTAAASAQPVSLRPRRPLGRVQAQIWASQRLHPEAPLANMAKRITIDAPLDPERFVAAFDSVVRSSDLLRATVADDDGQPRLRIRDEPPSRTAVIELDHDELDAWCDDRIARPVDATTCVYDSVLLRHGDERWTWWIDLHHVATDAMGSALVVEATSAAYAGEPFELVGWDRHLARQAEREADETWASTAQRWRALQSAPTPLALHGPVGVATTSADQLPVTDAGRSERLAEALAGDFRSLSPELGLLALLVTATAELVHRLDGRDEMIVGIPVHHRSDRDARLVPGPLMELFPLQIAIEADDTHRRVHKRVAKALMRLLRDAAPGSSPDQSFSAVVNVHGARYGSFAGFPATTRWPRSGHADPAHLLRVQAFDHDGVGPTVELDVNHAVADADLRSRLADRLALVVDRIIDGPDDAIGAAPLLVDDEAAEVAAWEHPPPVPAAERSLAERVADGLRRRGDEIAVEQGDRRLTGHELDRLVGRVAAWLRQRGLVAGDRIGIRVGRGIDAVALVHGAVRAGVGFVPLDPTHPVSRHETITADAGLATILDSLPDDLPEEAMGPVEVADETEAYVLYTSGSTGEPKGVPISRRGLDDYLTVAEATYVDPGRPPTVALHSSLVFDLTITSLFLPLTTAGLLVVVDAEGPAALAEVAADVRIDLLKATPSQLELLLRMADHFPYRHVIVGGEAFRRPLAMRVVERCEPDVSVWNEYGPTEAVVGCMIHRFDPDVDTGPDVPIGAPFPGCDVRILDAHGHPSPPGTWGELWVHRPGQATGYLNRPELSAERFVVLDRGTPHYGTGDRARFERPGVAVYGGRDDDQLKVGGIRLEPGEIEAALATHPDVTSAVVRVWTPTRRPVEQRHHCPRCGLADDVPDITFDEHGVCSVCRTFDVVRPQADAWFRTEDDLRARLESARARRRGDIDAVHLLSGGKDSTYALYHLVEQGWNVHALTLDNGFISDGAKENVRRSVADIGVSHEFVTTEAMNEIFRDSLERYSNVCNGCFKTIYTLAVNRAHELGAPVIVTGLSRGQFFETRLVPHQFEAGRFDPEAIDRTVLEARKVYHRTQDAVTEHLDTSLFETDDVFDEIEFVDFYRYVDVDLAQLYDFLEHRAPWIRPDDTGRSTNCLVNVAGIHVHTTERGHHNYAEPYAWDVRLGHKTRAEALDELDDEIDLDEVDRMLDEIGYRPQPPELLTAWYRSEDPIDPQELRRHLRDLVPEHAVPAAFVRVDDLPLAASAKVDTSRLPAPTRLHRSTAAFRAPQTEVEQRLAAIWAEVLGLERVGLDDDFFDVGGDSLAALEMITWATQQLDVRLPDAAAFQRRTLAELAEVLAIASSDASHEAEATPERRDGAPPLTPAQAALLVELRTDPDTTRYGVTRRYRIDGSLSAGALENALRHLVEAHESLRWTCGTTRRELTVDEALEVTLVAVPDVDLADREARRRFDPALGPLLRAAVAVDGDECREVVISAHHLWFDAGSFAALWRQVAEVVDGGRLPVRQLATTETDSAALEAAAAALPDDARGATWPTARLGSPESDGYLRLDVELTQRPARIVPTFLTAVATALGTAADTAIGVPMSTREGEAVRSAIGYHLNTVPVPLAEPRRGRPAADVVAEQDELLNRAWRHRHVPYAEVIGHRRQHGRTTDFARVMVVHDPDEGSVAVGDARLRGETIFHGAAVTDLSLFVTERDGGAVIAAEWSGRAHRRADVERLLDRIADSLQTLVADPTAPVGELAGSRSELIGPPIGTHEPVTTAIWSPGHADAVAIRHDGASLTYAELTDRAEQVAAALAVRGIRRGDLVGVALERSLDLAPAVLGIQRLGAGYVPIDPSYPRSRIDAILSSTRPRSVIHDHDLAELLATDVDVEPGPMPSPDDPAYVIHTSGSTGVPKGVLVRHRELATSTGARFEHYDASPGRFLWTSSIGFDSSIVGLFWTLAAGGELVLPSGPAGIDVDELAAQIVDDRITHLLTVPSLWASILRRIDDEHELRTVIVAGEACGPDLVDEHHRRLAGVDLWNEYGPTEATVWATVHRCRPGEDPVPIGRPIPGAIVRVADPHGRAVPVGVEGELLIGGAGVTDGYVTDPPATAERFVEHGGQRWYRSGDRSVLSADGTIGFLGRLDEQLSIGGVRVEPDEIERVLERQPGVRAAVVRAEPRLGADPTTVLAGLDPDAQRAVLEAAAREDDPARALVHELARAIGVGDALVAHVESAELDETAIRDALASELPRPLVPQRIVRHDALPRTAHGKLDRAALPMAAATSTSPAALDGDLDAAGVAAMVELWRDILGEPAIGPASEFLAVGGDSLLALELIDTIAERFGTEVPVARLQEAVTPAALARLVDGDRRGAPHVVTMRPGPADGDVIVIVPPAGGLLFSSQPLADAIDDVLVLGLQYPGADGRESPERSIDALASRLAPEVLDAAPSGRLHLVGASTGGLVAVELARELGRAGRAVELVALVDTYTPGQRLGIWRARRDKYARIIRDDGVAHIPAELVRKLRDRRRVARSGGTGRTSSRASTAVELPRMLDIARRAELAHELRPIELPIVLYAASGTNPRRTVRGWRKAAHDLTVVELEGTHTGPRWIMGPSHVERLAADLRGRRASISGPTASER